MRIFLDMTNFMLGYYLDEISEIVLQAGCSMIFSNNELIAFVYDTERDETMSVSNKIFADYYMKGIIDIRKNYVQKKKVLEEKPGKADIYFDIDNGANQNRNWKNILSEMKKNGVIIVSLMHSISLVDNEKNEQFLWRLNHIKYDFLTLCGNEKILSEIGKENRVKMFPAFKLPIRNQFPEKKPDEGIVKLLEHKKTICCMIYNGNDDIYINWVAMLEQLVMEEDIQIVFYVLDNKYIRKALLEHSFIGKIFFVSIINNATRDYLFHKAEVIVFPVVKETCQMTLSRAVSVSLRVMCGNEEGVPKELLNCCLCEEINNITELKSAIYKLYELEQSENNTLVYSLTQWNSLITDIMEEQERNKNE